MVDSVVNMRVLESGERTDRLLVQVAEKLGLEKLMPQAGQAHIVMFNMEPGEAYDAVRKALDESDPAWDELVTIEPRRE
jgi:hypothetical protein